MDNNNPKELSSKPMAISINLQAGTIGNKKKPTVFVLMPFHTDFDDIYELGIRAACDAVGASCERVDKQIFVEDILDQIYQQIEKADVVISEMTGRNPNVFYETGYAHALHKRVILLTKEKDDIPFDLLHYPHIIYGGKISYLKSELGKRIKWCIDNPPIGLDSASRQGRFSEIVSTQFFNEALANSFIKLQLQPAFNMTSEESFEQASTRKPFSIRVAEDMFSLDAKLLDRDGNLIGKILNRFPTTVYSNDYIITLLAMLGPIAKLSDTISWNPDLKSAFVLENAELIKRKLSYSEVFFVMVPVNESDFAAG